MRLKERLNDSIITNINIVESENRMCYDYNHLELAEKCQKVAEEFAIGFAEWCCAKNMGVSKFTLYEGELELYKKEKDL